MSKSEAGEIKESDLTAWTKDNEKLQMYEEIDKLRADLATCVTALEKIVEADRMRYGCDPYPVIAARALAKLSK